MPEFLKRLIKEHFNGEESEFLLQESDKEYRALLPLADNETRSRRKNLVKGIYPFVALYHALLSENKSRDEAMKLMFEVMKAHTLSGNRRNYERLGKLPFFFSVFRKMFTMGLSGDSWEVDWVANDSERFIYNIRKCLWHDTCMELGCPELCRIFCRNDEINFTDVSRHLYFERSRTLGDGDDCCDFHFYPGKFR